MQQVTCKFWTECPTNLRNWLETVGYERSGFSFDRWTRGKYESARNPYEWTDADRWFFSFGYYR